MSLKKHQIECKKNIEEHFKKNNKGLIKMFCGSGKSFIIYDSLLTYGIELSVIVVPSINLITQFKKDYLLNKKLNKFNKEFETITICSKDEIKDKNTIFTSDNDEIKNFLIKKNNKIVLTTYQSFDKFAIIIKNNKLNIDILCFDEAHHITGIKIKQLLFGYNNLDNLDNINDINDINNINNTENIDENFIECYVKKTLFFTATPLNKNNIIMYLPHQITLNNIEYEFIDENNIEILETPHCGKIIYEYTHIKGVNDGILNDFKIKIDIYTENKETSIFNAISRAILETNNTRILTFHSRSEIRNENKINVIEFTNKKNEFISCFNKIINCEFPNLKNKYKNIRFCGITAKTQNKTKILQEFDNTPDDEIFILSSCKTIGEGIDTKKANMVVFIDSKQSYVDIIQNIGRICRKQERKSTVLIPCYLDINKYKECYIDENNDKFIAQEMYDGNFNCILNVLCALRQENPYMFDLCLQNSEFYSDYEIEKNLDKYKLKIQEEKVTISKLFENYCCKYYLNKSEYENFNNFSKKIKKNIQILSNKKNETDIYIDNKFNETKYFIKTLNEKYKEVQNKKKINENIKKPVRNIEPEFNINDEIKILWKINDYNELSKKLFSGYIEATVMPKSEKTWHIIFNKVINYIDNNKKRPNVSDNNKENKMLSCWIANQINNFKLNIGLMKNNNIRMIWENFTKKYKQYFISYIELWKQKLEKMTKFIDENNKCPSINSDDKNEKYLAQWLKDQKKIYELKIEAMRNTELRKLWEDFVKKYNIKSKNKDNRIYFLKKLDEVKNYIKNYGFLPSSINDELYIKNLGIWLDEQIQNKNKRKEMIFFLEEYKECFNNDWNKCVNNWINILSKTKSYIDENKKIPDEEDFVEWFEIFNEKYLEKRGEMKYDFIRNIWSEFIKIYKNYKKNNKPSNKSVYIEENKKDKKNTIIQKKEKNNFKKMSEYQILTKKMSIQKSITTKNMFEKNPKLWESYHIAREFSFKGYDEQNEIPVNKIILYLETKKNRKLKILDLGCGRNLIKQHFINNDKFEITGYDYISHNGSKQVDISNLPDDDESINICIYSQSLMGSNWRKYIDEGKRVLNYNGEMIISESKERYYIIKKYIEKKKLKIIKDEYDETKRWFYLYIINN